MRKKLFTFLLAIVASMGPIFAESGTCGENLTWDLTDSVLTISGTGAMTDYEWRGTPWYSNQKSIKAVVIENGVTSIGDYAFCFCSGLTSVTIPNSVTSIGYWAFDFCYSLTSVTLNSSAIIGKTYTGYSNLNHIFGSQVTEYIIGNQVTIIGSCAFSGCRSLTSVTIGNGVTSIGDDAFYECSSLTSVTIPNSVTSIGEDAFYGCSSLASVTIPNSVTSIGNSTFYHCTSLISVTIPSSVTSIGYRAFSGCSSLTSVTIPNSVTSIGNYTFDDCSSLTSVSIPNSVSIIGGFAFAYCSSLSSVTIPNSVSNIGMKAFYGCRSLTSVTVPNSVTSIEEEAFCNVPNIVYSGSATGSPWGARCVNGYVDGWLVYADASRTTLLVCSAAAEGEIVIPNSVTSIGDWAFSDCRNLTSVTIPNSVTSIGSYAFYNCSSLTSVTIPNSVTSIDGYAFYNCSSLTSVSIPNSVTSIGSCAFSGCSSLTSVTIPNSVTNIERSAFSGCTSLTSVTIPNSVKSIGSYAFQGCSSLASVTIPNSVTSIGNSTFSNCSSLTSVTIPNSVTSIRERAFYECSSLTSVTIPNSVTSIGDYAFSGCRSLTSPVYNAHVFAYMPTSYSSTYTIPDGIETIAGGAFRDCTALTSVTIPNSVTSIGSSAFSYCSKLANIYVEATNPPSISSTTFSNIASEALVHVQFGYAGLYRSANYWKNMNIQVVINHSILTSPTGVNVGFTTDGDIASCGISGGEQQPGNVLEYIGLEPESEYKDVPIVLTSNTGETETVNVSFTTTALELTTKASKPVSGTTAILLAETNMSDAEVSCGFEYKRNDAPEDMAGTKVFCPVASGQMAGRLKNLKDDVYYKYRAFYQSAAGNMYYGDWQYIFTGDVAVEFDPILYTYGATVVKENEATISGYALAGSEDFTEQGFEYWAETRTNCGANAPHRMPAALGEHFFVQASGIALRATLTNLDAGTVYKYRVYGKVGDQYYYGSEQTFTTQGTYTPPTYTITFANWDGTELQSSQVEEGTLPEYTGATPERPENEQYIYTFNGWSPAIVAATADATYTAQYISKDKHEGIGEIPSDQVQSTKLLHNGVLYIERNGKTYTVTGAEVK